MQSAIKSLQQRLKRLDSRNPPTNGWAVFSGWTKESGQITVELAPAGPVKSVIYRCSNEFFLGPIEELVADAETEEQFGILVVDGNGALFAVLQGMSRRVLQEITVELPTGHRRGGQSQNRFARLRDEKVHRYLRQVAELAIKHYTKDGLPVIGGLVLAGPTDLKDRLLGHSTFPRCLADVLLKSVDLAHGGRRGLAQAVEESLEVIGSKRLKDEMQMLETFFESVERGTDMSCFSARDTMEALYMGAVKTLIVSETLDVRCRELPDGVVNYTSGASDSDKGDEKSLQDWLFDNYQKFGCQLQIVSDQSSQGVQFQRGYGGIGATLRWQIDFVELLGCEEEGANDNEGDLRDTEPVASELEEGGFFM